MLVALRQVADEPRGVVLQIEALERGVDCVLHPSARARLDAGDEAEVLADAEVGVEHRIQVKRPAPSEWPMLLAFFASVQSMIDNGGSKTFLVLGPQQESMTVIAMADQAKVITGLQDGLSLS